MHCRASDCISIIPDAAAPGFVCFCSMDRKRKRAALLE